ncbi:cytochrome c biogenesis protein CcsA, partial [Spirochaetota bacterium]
MNLGKILIFAVVVELVIASAYYLKGKSDTESSAITPQRLYYLSTLFMTLVIILLTVAFLTNDFRYVYVYNNSSKDLEWYYLLSAVWAGKSGSFLLWAFVLNVMGLFVIRAKDDNEKVLMTVISLTQIFIVVILILDSPFKHIWEQYPNNFKIGQVPMDGAGLNPLLRDPWMVFHPPILFIGYASATIPFAYAISSLIKGEFTEWVKNSYNWVLFSMTTLGVGIFMGGYWAYKVLGWGGYWGWDPVENSSLIPWLVVVALMHGMLLQKRKKALVKTNIILAAFYFVLVFYSTFLTRSGILSNFSVHSFGKDAGITIALTIFMVASILITAYLFLKKSKYIESPSLGDKIWSWETLLIYGIVTVVIYSIIILIGTSMPILSGLVMPKPSPVTQNYYNNISIPFGLLILFLMVSSTIKITSKKVNIIVKAAFIAAAVILGVMFNIFFTKKIVAYIFVGVALFVIIQNIADLIKHRAPTVLTSRITHIGFSIMIIGIIASNFHSTSYKKQLELDKEGKVGPVQLTFKGIEKAKRDKIKFFIKKNEKEKSIKMLYYFNQKMKSLYREPYVESGFLNDLYLTPENYRPGKSNASIIGFHQG